MIYQRGFGVIERIREEIDFGKKITFTVNHCDHVILTWIVFQTDFEGITRKNDYAITDFNEISYPIFPVFCEESTNLYLLEFAKNDLKSRSHAFSWIGSLFQSKILKDLQIRRSVSQIQFLIEFWAISEFFDRKSASQSAEKTCDPELSLYLYQDRYP